MRLFPKTLKVNPDNIFENDCLERRSLCHQLMSVVGSIDESMVINLDAKWGDGKTTFLHLWREYLKSGEERYESVYIDAFEHDYLDDPFVAVTGEILKSLKDDYLEHTLPETRAPLKKAAIKAGKAILSKGAGIGVKALTLNTISAEDFKDVEKDISDALKNGVTSYLEDKFEENEDKQSLDQFRNQLQKAAKEIKESQNFPLMIIIDELDRCRPSYAMELLEKVKHLFAVENVVFVLSMNNEQMESSIRSIYGADIDAKEYLQKFYQVYKKLPKRYGYDERKNYGQSNDYMQFCRSMTKRLQLDDTKPESEAADTLARAISAFSEFYNLSLRQIEKVYTSLMLSWPRLYTYQWDVISVSALFAIWKLTEPELYSQASNKYTIFSELEKKAGLNSFPEDYYTDFNFDGVKQLLQKMYDAESTKISHSVPGMMGRLASPEHLRSMIITNLEAFRID